MPEGLEQEEKGPGGSSFQILANLLPVLFAFFKVIIFHPKQAGRVFKMAQTAQKQAKHVWQRDETELPYTIPTYQPGMKFCKSEKKYLRPSRLIESDTPEIIAMANQLGAFQKSDQTYADQCFNFIQKNIRFSFVSPLKGARKTLITGEGTCFDKANLFLALCRAGHIPARLKSMNTAVTQQIYDVYTGEIPFVKDLYDAVGYFAVHTMAEAFVDGKWQPADVSIDDCYQASIGLPLSRFGNDPLGTWNWEVPGGTYRYEQVPWILVLSSNMVLKLFRGLLLVIQDSFADRLMAGRRILDELGGEEEYDRKIRRTYKAKLPEVSKRLFKLLAEEIEGGRGRNLTDSGKGPNR